MGFVADGMGGHAGGKRASEEATRVIMDALAAAPAAGTDGATRLKLAIEEANRRIWALPQTEPALHGLGTTIAALLVEGAVGHVAHVGDSRVYCIRDGAIEVLTRDHSYLNDLAARGVQLTDQAMRARYESVLTRALGVAPTVEVEQARRELRGGDTIVICSDGIYRVVAPDQLAALVARSGDDLDAACAAIIASANDGGGPDNCTIVLLRCDGDGTGAGGAGDGGAATGTRP